MHVNDAVFLDISWTNRIGDWCYWNYPAACPHRSTGFAGFLLLCKIIDPAAQLVAIASNIWANDR
jgi:hypothetical protein